MSDDYLRSQLEDLFSDTDASDVDVELPAVALPEVDEAEARFEEAENAAIPSQPPADLALPTVDEPPVVEKPRRNGARFHPRWSIGAKLVTASALMLFLVILAGGTGLWQMWRVGQAMDKAFAKAEQRAWADNLATAGYRLVAALDRLLLEQEYEISSAEVQPALGMLKFHLEALEESGEVEDATLLGETRSAYDDLRQAVSEVDLLARTGQWTEMAAALEQQVRPANDKMRLVTIRLAQRASQEATEAAELGRFVFQQAVVLVAVLVLLAAAIAVVWRQTVFGPLGGSIAELRGGVARISGGDLTYGLDIRTGDEIEELAGEFNSMAAQLHDVISTLEQRVADRTGELDRRATQLNAATQVSRAASSVLEPEVLINQVVHLIRDRFGYYYVGLFLVDAAQQWAVLQAGTGEAGRKMLDRGHKLAVGGESMIGRCTSYGQARIALDVGEEAVRFDNPLLPETRSEMALPLIARGRVIGALTVQSGEPQAFSDEDISVLQTMADQVANAIENARLLQETERLARRSQLVSDVSVRLRGALGLEGILETTVRELGQALGASEAVIRLGPSTTLARASGDGRGDGEEVMT